MPELGKSGSVGALGEKSPGATRLIVAAHRICYNFTCNRLKYIAKGAPPRVHSTQYPHPSPG